MFAMHEEDGLIINKRDGSDKFLKISPYDLKKNSYLYEKYGIIDHYEQFKKQHLGEERRIWYVAITRAKQLLYLSCPKPIDDDGKKGSSADFFVEILDEFADEGRICEFRNAEELAESAEAELPLWRHRTASEFRTIEEAEAYGKRLMEMANSYKEF